MAKSPDFDRYFSGKLDSATPPHLLPEGTLTRTHNCRLFQGAVTNAIGFDDVPLSFALGGSKRLPNAGITYEELLTKGDPQLLAPLTNVFYSSLIFIVSGRMLTIDPKYGLVADITPVDAYLPERSSIYPLSYAGNDAGASGIGGTLVVCNGPNRPLFVTSTGARISSKLAYEMPPMRLAATVGNRLWGVSGSNLLYASDAFGTTGSAPLTFSETLRPGDAYFGQIFTIGSILDGEYVTAICRLPKFLGPSSEYIAQNLFTSTEEHKYLIAAGSPRETWVKAGSNFSVYAGTNDGIAGPLAVTVIGSNIAYITKMGRTKLISQDQEKDTGLRETFFDNPIGQYLNTNEHSFHFRDWYSTLDHSRSIVRFNRGRLYATVYPVSTPALTRHNVEVSTISHRALAVGSLDSNTLVGPTSTIVWESFYDWFQPCLMTTLRNDLYILAKDRYGKMTLLKQNLQKRDDHTSIVFTRAYFASDDKNKAKSLMKGELYFRKLAKPFDIQIYYLNDGDWCATCKGRWEGNTYQFSVGRSSNSAGWGIPLRIELDHKGVLFEMESPRLVAEALPGF